MICQEPITWSVHWSTHFSLSSVHSFLEFRRAPERVWKRTWISMKNSCSSLVTGSLEQQQQKRKNNFSFLITHFVFPFPFPIPAFSNIGICLIFKMADFAAKRSSRCHTVSFLENGSYRGQGSWMKTELNGPKLAQETHTMLRNSYLSEVTLSRFFTSAVLPSIPVFAYLRSLAFLSLKKWIKRRWFGK